MMESKWFKYFLINWFLSLILLEWALYKLKPCLIKTEEDKKQAEKYPAFRRNDKIKANRVLLYVLAPFTFARFIIGWGSMVYLYFWTWGVNLIVEENTQKSRKLKDFGSFCAARMIIFMMSGLWIENTRFKTDYSKYLGPDWKRSYKNPGTVISNHATFLDIVIHMYR